MSGDPQGHLRIIGGAWRGRKLGFRPQPGLRPTADRIRETLFNWLAPELHDARCLDLFAGSGALGLEALSRGAAFCSFVDNSGTATSTISDHLHTLKATDKAECITGSAENVVQQQGRTPYHLVFVDPPFAQRSAAAICQQLAVGELLQPEALVYVETAAGDDPAMPAGWHRHRDKTGGQVRYQLWRAS